MRPKGVFVQEISESRDRPVARRGRERPPLLSYRQFVWVLIIILSGAAAIQVSTPSRGPLTTCSPDFYVYFADVRFNLDNRSISYRLQISFSAKTLQRGTLYFKLANPLGPAGGPDITVENVGPQGERYFYQGNKPGIVDKVYGLYERYPFDSYQADYSVAAYVEPALGFGEKFTPCIVAYMNYPDSFGLADTGCRYCDHRGESKSRVSTEIRCGPRPR